MNKRRVLRGTVVIVVVVLLLPVVGCSEGPTFIDGELPVFKVGDQWVWTQLVDGESLEWAVEVSELGSLGDKECYILDSSFSPPLHGYFNFMKMWIWMDEPFFSVLKTQMDAVVLGEPVSSVVEFETEFSDQQRWPLEVGVEFTRSTTITEVTTFGGDVTTDSKMETVVVKVEGKEDIAVSAGEFSCFVIREYSEDNELQNTVWYSDEVKNDVKIVDLINGVDGELKSFTFV